MLGHAVDVATFYAMAHPPAVDKAKVTLVSVRPFFGVVWVVGFFVLSGYCIARSCDRPDFSLLRYAAMRITRIYPLLIVGVALGGIVEFIMLGSPHRPNVWTGDIDLAHFFMTVTGFDTFGALAPAYTIAYELLCYIVFGIAWWLLRPRSLLAI